GVMCLPEGREDFVIRNDLRIKLNLDHLRMPGFASAHILIGWINLRATGVSARYGLNSGQHLEQGFSAPETTPAEGGSLSVICCVLHRFGLGVAGQKAAQQESTDEEKSGNAVH